MPALDLLGHHGPDDLVAFGGAGDKRAADLLADAGRIAAQLPAPSPGSHVLLVFEEDRYAMAAALLGAAAAGHAAALPPNNRRDSILAVHQRPEIVATIHDTGAGLPHAIHELLAEGAASAAPLAAPLTPPGDTFATVFTSGTTGPVQPWRKSGEVLLGEAHMLARAFDIGPGDRIVGTVAPGHIYGLLFTVLLPLARGAAFSRETPLHASAIAHCVAHHAASVLVSVPVGLRACSALPAGAFPGLRRVFSSTGPLPAEVVRDFRERHAHPITELLGSTETGGIATRARNGESGDVSERWRPLEGVRVSLAPGGRLEVDSPYVHAELERPFTTQDLVELHEDGSFTHLGRADHIVKIGGRRVSVPEVEECIRRHAEVEDAAVAAVPAEGGRGHQLLAAVAPRSCSPQDIRKALLKQFEPSCLPRRILCVKSLPRERNGKLPRARLLRLFDLAEDGQPLVWQLAWGEPTHERDSEGERFAIHARVPEDYAWFDGHFEQYPVLAGAVQVKELLLPTAARAFPELGHLEAMSRVKFLKPIQPGDPLAVRLERSRGANRVRFEIARDGEVCSTGQLRFAPPGRDSG